MVRLSSPLANDSGAAATEMALMLPLLLVLMFTCLEGGNYLFVEHQVVKGVRDAARFAARQAFSNYVCGTTTVPSALDTNIKNVARYGKVTVTASDNPRVSTWTAAATAVSVSCPATALSTGIYSQVGNAPRVTVRATLSYPSLFKSLTGINSSFTIYAEDQAPVMGV